ncbi:hypothetical protein VTJ49DRAFT_7534 [Mycothermus thermophilus]|uniref:Conserved oligomeric Golgi complex subunit 6 n=1 Tax=Humicola insolens TaxID=85995 RepID=A0ABR3VH75_HUMIN
MASTSGPLSPQGGSASPSLAGKAANPLSSKVVTVLSSSYTDTEFREALGLLDERGISNTAETRRRLRLDLQKEVIDSNGEIIDDFAKVAEQLRRIGATIGRLNDTFREMKTQIDAAHAATSSALTEASQLMSQRRQIEQKQALLTAFNAHFVLSEDEIAILTLTSEPVNDLFFAALAKTKRISKDCEILLGFENQTLGLDIMDQTSKNLNLGFQKLYKWVQKEFKTLNLENPQIGSSIRRALRVLAERPTLFQNCLDFFSEARETVLSNSFYAALTGRTATGVEDSSAKPIELVAHDVLRYVGDMLAWMHSAAVGEREALENLFIAEGDEIAKGIQVGRDNEIWRLVADEGEELDEFDAVKTLNELVDRDMSGAARMLRQRVEQVIQTNEETIMAYKLANLLSFYKTTFSRMLSSESSLVAMLAGLEGEALRQFRSLARDHVAAIQSDFQQTPSDLRPPEFLADALEQLTAIMKTYETAFTASNDREDDFEPVLTEAFDPFISGAENMAKSLRGPSSSIFLINCLITARSSLAPFEFTQRRTAKLEARIEEEKRRLVETQYHFFRTFSGLDALITSLGALSESNREDVKKVASLDVVQAPSLTQASQVLDNFLPSALMDAVEKLKHLQDARLARDITEEAAERFCVDFEHMEEMLMLADELAEEEKGEEEEFQSLRALFPRTSGEIRVLLSTATAASILQKTYDESYLMCSTAVYYEGQGDEAEAMRCWRQALEQIYDHNANRLPPTFTPRSDTEKALVHSIRQLELQCKERIDLLEALRISRQEALCDSDILRLRHGLTTLIFLQDPIGDKTEGHQNTIRSTEEDEDAKAAKAWKRKKAAVLKKLPPGVDQHAAKQILNEIVVRGDEVHWTDIAGLEVAKNALRETVVYPFLRPDLFMGLREPARGMLLFGPPGTGKTMLARAVATESKSTFFSISASSLTSKYLGESEKLVRALFALAKVLAPSIIFVDEIDSLLSQRSGTGEHEATRRIKTEFLIQWSDLQRAAAGREPVGEKEKERGDANRVLVLAATNLPWAIDEAARRRFVRRQYIPLPEPETRKVQIRTLLKQQQHTLSEEDIETLVGLTDGFSGSDITALAKDAAMGPLRSLGDALLHMTMEEIRPIELSDFVASLSTIRPSVSKASLKEYEDWAREFGERGG